MELGLTLRRSSAFSVFPVAASYAPAKDNNFASEISRVERLNRASSLTIHSLSPIRSDLPRLSGGTSPLAGGSMIRTRVPLVDKQVAMTRDGGVRPSVKMREGTCSVPRRS